MNVTNNLKLPQYTEEDIFDLQDINKAYDSIDKAYKEVIDFKNEIPKTNATAEVIDARGGKETLGERLNEFDEQLETIETNISIVTPEMFGAKGDGVTDDYEALKKMFNSGYNIKFGHNKTYITSQICFHYNTYGGVIDGNNSTIKLIDNSGILEQIKNSSQTVAISQLLFLGNDNITIKNLNFDCNIDNNYFIFNGEKYYGYHADIKVDGIPSKYITIDCIYTQGNNDIKIYNCKFKDFGTGISLGGGVHDTNQLSYNFYVENCTFEHGFRDQIYCFQVRNVNIKNCTFTNNQRKAIQFYQNVQDCYVDKCNITINSGEIRKWYPTWSTSQPDAELSGIACQNPNYYLNKYRVANINITDTKFNNCKTGIWFRGYSKGLIIKKCEFNGGDHQINLNSGVEGKVIIKENKFINSNFAIYFRLAKDNRLDFETNIINSEIEITSNTMFNKGYLLLIEDEQNRTDYYKKLIINVSKNNLFEDSNFISLNSNRTTQINSFIQLEQTENYKNNSEIFYTYGASQLFVNALNFRDNKNLYFKIDLSGSGYVELLKIKSNRILNNFFFNCKIYPFTGNTCDYGEVVGIIRTHYSDIATSGYADIYINNRRRSMPINAIKVVDTYEDGYRVFRIYLNVPSNANGRYCVEMNYNNINGFGVEQNKTIAFVTPVSGNVNESKE